MIDSLDPILITSVAALYALPWKWPAIILIAVGCLALYGSLVPAKTMLGMSVHLLMIVPQQLVLFMAAVSALNAMHNGRFADGTIRSHHFITTDQCIYPIFAFCHFCAVINQFLCDPLMTKFKPISL